jgi:hypothetical protein
MNIVWNIPRSMKTRNMLPWIFDPQVLDNTVGRLVGRTSVDVQGCRFPLGSCQLSRGRMGRRFRADVRASQSDEVGTGVTMGYITGYKGG